MKPCVLCVSLLLWTSFASAAEPITFFLHIDELSTRPFRQLTWQSEDRGRHNLGARHFVLRESQDSAWLLTVSDWRISSAVLEFLAERAGARELNLFIHASDLKYVYSSRSSIGIDWNKLMVVQNGELLDLGEIAAYIRWQQGLFSRNVDPYFVKTVVHDYLVETPRFGKMQKCARLLAHFPLFNPFPE